MKIIAWFVWCLVALFAKVSAGGGGKGGEHVKIIIPHHEKTIKHTHTIYKTIYHIPQKGGDDGHSHGGKPFHWGW